MAVIGIDLGTTYSMASVWQGNRSILIPNRFGDFLTPSAVGIDESGALLIGKSAIQQLLTRPEATIVSFKRFMGTKRIFFPNSLHLNATDLSSLILRQLRLDAQVFLDEAVEEAIVSVPAYFNDNQRAAVKHAAALAGLHVNRLVNEPSAAALHHRMNGLSFAEGDDEDFLVVDFGGGTLDVSVVSCFDQVIEIVAVSGNNRLGGDDFDRAIAAYFCSRMGLDEKSFNAMEQSALKQVAEQAKMMLSKMSEAQMTVCVGGESHTLTLRQTELRQLSEPILRKLRTAIERVMADAGLYIAKVVLVGGTSKMPLIAQYLRELAAVEFVMGDRPDEIVALGVGAYAGIKARHGAIKDMLLTDVCPFTLGTNIKNAANVSDPLMSPIIERNTTLPCSRTESFTTSADLQTQLKFGIYQGEAMYCTDNVKLGDLCIEIPEAPQGEESVDVTFSYDINGILDVEIKNSCGLRAKKLIVSDSIRFTEEELARKVAVLEELKTPLIDREENRLLLARAQRIFAESTGKIRTTVSAYTEMFQQSLAEGKMKRVRDVRFMLINLLDQLEQRGDSALGFFYRMEEEEE